MFEDFLKLFNYNDINYITILFFNTFSYVFLIFLLFGIFFLFDVRYFRTLNEFKGFGNLQFITLLLILVFLSLAGIPPLVGFVGKFLLFSVIISGNNIYFLFIFILTNLFFMFFYLQNIRFVISKQSFTFFNIKNYNVYLDAPLISTLVFLNFFNIFGIFFFNHIYIYIYNIILNLYLY